MKGPHPHFHLLCCSFPTKTKFLSTLLPMRQKNNATDRLWVVFVFGRWRNSEKRTKPSKKRFAQGYRLGFLQWRKSHERMTTVSVFLEKSTPAMNKTRWGEDHQFNMYIFTYRYEASEKVQVYQEAWSESFLLVTFCWEQSPFMYFLHTT